MGLATALVIALATASETRPEFVALFAPREVRYTGRDNQERAFPYRLFVPECKQGKNYPLIVWLHGWGESASDNIQQLRWLDSLIFHSPWRRSDYPFFLLAVQCPRDNRAWLQPGKVKAPIDMIDVAMAAADDCLRAYPIDPDRITVAGLSGGGTGCWDLALRYADRLAAVATLASSGSRDRAPVERLLNLPLWAFHSARDNATSGVYVRRSIDALRQAGARAYLTEIDSAEHNCWSQAFEDYDLLGWLLAQRRGRVTIAPGSIAIRGRLIKAARGWTIWQLVIVAAVPLALALGGWTAMRGSRRDGSVAASTPAPDR